MAKCVRHFLGNSSFWAIAAISLYIRATLDKGDALYNSYNDRWSHATTGNEFGRFFRSRRTVLGLNLSEFCRQNGFDKGNISRLERGLMKPPESLDLLQSYADALQLQPDSEDWKAFMRHAAIARGKLPSAVSDERPPTSKRFPTAGQAASRFVGQGTRS